MHSTEICVGGGIAAALLGRSYRGRFLLRRLRGYRCRQVGFLTAGGQQDNSAHHDGTLAEKSGPDSPQSGARSITGALLLGGGIPVLVSGSVVGGVGVSGAPTGAADHGCAAAGIEAVTVKLELEG